MHKSIKVLSGEIFNDYRGQISSLNNFRFSGVERVYFIHHPDISIIRGWHAHQFEKKWFYCVKGSFKLALVEIDNWKKPSETLKAEMFYLSDQKSEIVCVPEGYANCLKATTPDSVMMVFSSKILEEALTDSWRYDKNLWVNWEEEDKKE